MRKRKNGGEGRAEEEDENKKERSFHVEERKETKELKDVKRKRFDKSCFVIGRRFWVFII